MRKGTKQKEAILRVLRNTNSHPTADWVYSEVRKEIPNISLGTVYRNLRLLEQEGDILELECIGNSLCRFVYNTEPHYHFKCERCGHIFDLDMPINKRINEKVAQKTGFQISRHILEFFGLYQDCQS